ncbi:sigma-70 family RNA polymerase sigma factor [Bacillus sp. FJAT-29790]|uniref:sigma-70 family RNA polymerase sigma factor n=1 Tax=Bacillus sp. FJAT-29790 TaxID=1895002 RepID=UPI001C21D4A5|nr:sigma-70 family RNA polymerase sigma factor [Bacillus sp. FJAT-29790]MBU8878353.1 sigma-70 family RNA polymerase sigma factor [Bacillus sp. FJAT-29790]
MENLIAEGFSVHEKEEILNEMMDQYGQELLQLVYSYVKNYAIAEELTQEVFVKIYERLHTFKQQSSLRTWLWRITINHCKDYLKSWNYRKVLISDKLAGESKTRKEAVEKEVIQKSEEELLSKAVLNLPVKYREVIYFHFFEEFSIREIETLTGVNQNTVKTRIKRAKDLLKKELEGKL